METGAEFTPTRPPWGKGLPISGLEPEFSGLVRLVIIRPELVSIEGTKGWVTRRPYPAWTPFIFGLGAIMGWLGEGWRMMLGIS